MIKKRTTKKSITSILVYIESHQGQIAPVSLELIACAARLAAQNTINHTTTAQKTSNRSTSTCSLKETAALIQSQASIYGIIIGTRLNHTHHQLSNYPLEKIFLYEAEDHLLPDLYKHYITTCIDHLHPDIVLIGATREGRTLSPLLAAHYKTGLTADCTDLSLTPAGDLLQIRPAFGGNIMAHIITPDTRPQIATVRPGIMKPICPAPSCPPTFIYHQNKPAIKSRCHLINTHPLPPSATIADAKILIAGGRALKNKKDISLLKDLATLLNAQIAGSRALVEKGFIPPDHQIGLSGSTVHPDLLITAGISGSIQFCTGIKNAKYIIAINTDENAEILNMANLPIVGDLYNIIPELMNHIKTN